MIENNLALDAVEANCIKAYIIDLMQQSAQALAQPSGANGYKAENVGGRGIMDSRPFQVFEGSNEMLYLQISEVVLKMMVRQKMMNLSGFFKSYELTKYMPEHFNFLMNFSLAMNIPQRKMVDLGKIVSRVVAANQVTNIGDKGSRADLIRDSLESMKHEISMLVSPLRLKQKFHSLKIIMTIVRGYTERNQVCKKITLRSILNYRSLEFEAQISIFLYFERTPCFLS